MCLFCFLSKNENNDGFDTICLNSSLFDYKRVAKIHFTAVFRIVFPSRFSLDWMRNLHNEHHLAAKNGTFLRVKMRGRLYYERSFEVVVFLYIFCNNSYHQIEMISFIKLFSCHSIFPAAAHAVEVSCSCWLI
jgi:hypothetical protein